MLNKWNKSNGSEVAIKILKIAGTGLLLTAVSILSPTLPYILLRAYLNKKFGTKYSNKQVDNAARYLKRKNFIAFENKGNKFRLILTKFGQNKLRKVSISEVTIKPTPWDGQWRVLTFDVPEKDKPARHFFRKKLKQLGFFHFQRSVFILPYDCEKEIDLIVRNLMIRPYVHLLIARRFEGDKAIVKKFKLKV